MGEAGKRSFDCFDIENAARRGFFTAVSVVGLNLAIDAIPALAQPESERPKEGDLLVSIESKSANALEPKDIPLGGPPLLAWPMIAADKTIRKDSRLNKILLLRLDPSTLVGATQDRAAESVVAYSAICPHAGCEVNVWAAEQQTLECSCHYSHYNPRDGAAVIDGPAPRALAALPLKIVGGKLAVAKPFTGRVGIAPS
jgi:Rieske Fe-S protein